MFIKKHEFEYLKRIEEIQNERQSEAAQQKRKEAFCKHCIHGLSAKGELLTICGDEPVYREVAICTLESPCEKFRRNTES